MNFLVGSAPKIQCEIDADQVAGTTLTLESLIDPEGNELANSEVLDFGTGDEANVGSHVWQSSTTSPAGRYRYVVKAANATLGENFAEGAFMLVERPS